MNQKNNTQLAIDLLVDSLSMKEDIDIVEDIIISEKGVHPSTLLSEWINEMGETANREKLITRNNQQALTILMKLL